MDDASVEGIEDFKAQSLQLKAKLEFDLSAILLGAVVPITAEIQARMPVRTGDLSRHLQVTASKTSNGASATIEIADSEVGEAEQKAVFLEFGTSKMAAEPFFRPGFEAGKERTAQMIIDGVLKSISG
jgi:HK97 gp10 family phage protein